MAYELYIGDRTFSSWSLRGWLMLKSFDIPFKSQMLGLYNGSFEKDLAPLAPARQVPILKTPKGHIVFDTLAIAETLAEAHPSAALWPKDPEQRGAARLSRAKAEKPQPQPSQKKWQWPMKAAHKQRGARGPNYTANARCQPSAHQLTSDTATQPRRRA